MLHCVHDFITTSCADMLLRAAELYCTVCSQAGHRAQAGDFGPCSRYEEPRVDLHTPMCRCGTTQWLLAASRTAACARRCWRCAHARVTRAAPWPCTTPCGTRHATRAWRPACTPTPALCALRPTAAPGKKRSPSGTTWLLQTASPQVPFLRPAPVLTCISAFLCSALQKVSPELHPDVWPPSISMWLESSRSSCQTLAAQDTAGAINRIGGETEHDQCLSVRLLLYRARICGCYQRLRGGQRVAARGGVVRRDDGGQH